MCFGVGDGDDAVCHMFFQRQKCECATIEETFASGVLIGNFVACAENENGASEIVHISGNA